MLVNATTARSNTVTESGNDFVSRVYQTWAVQAPGDMGATQPPLEATSRRAFANDSESDRRYEETGEYDTQET